MKYLRKLSYIFLVFTLIFASCESDEQLVITQPEASFELQQPGINNIFLNFSLPNNPAFTVTWNDNLTAGASYEIEMSADDQFSSPVVLGTTSEKSFSMSVNDFNAVLNDLGFLSFESLPVYIRITSGDQVSNSILYLVTTYAVEVPEISNLDNFSIVLSDVDPEAVAVSIEITDPELGDNNTATVSYELQLAEGGTNFAEVFSLGTTSESTLDVTHGALNEAVLTSNGTPDMQGSFDVRVIGTITTPSGDLIRTSDGVTITITPYSIELPPVLYGVGAAIVGTGWSWDNPLELVLQGNRYVGNIELTNDTFRFFTENNNWGSGQNFPYYVDRGYTIDANFEDALDGDNNFRFTGTPGLYSIEIDTENETITLAPPIVGVNCEFDQLWGVGAAIVGTGWGWGNPTEFRCTGTGVYEGNVELTNDTFRFFTERDNWNSGRNYPYYVSEGFTIDSNFEDALDGDNNFRFTGTPGTYFLSVNTVDKTITLAPEMTCEFDQLWGVGAAIVGTGWGWTNPLEISCTNFGLYQSSIELQNGEAFRFFTIRDDWGSGRNFPYYLNQGYTIDFNLVDALDGDNNFRFIGVSGTYTITIDTVVKKISLVPQTINCEFDQLWGVGAAIVGTGWGWDTPLQISCNGSGVYQSMIELQNGEAFRFFTIRDDWGSGRNYPYYVSEGFTIDADFEDALDGDNNFRFTGTSGTYLLTINTTDKTITLQ